MNEQNETPGGEILVYTAEDGSSREYTVTITVTLGPDDDIARFEYLKKSARNFGSVLIGIETKNAANFADLAEKLDAAGFTYRDITDDKALAEFLI